MRRYDFGVEKVTKRVLASRISDLANGWSIRDGAVFLVMGRHGRLFSILKNENGIVFARESFCTSPYAIVSTAGVWLAPVETQAAIAKLIASGEGVSESFRSEFMLVAEEDKDFL